MTSNESRRGNNITVICCVGFSMIITVQLISFVALSILIQSMHTCYILIYLTYTRYSVFLSPPHHQPKSPLSSQFPPLFLHIASLPLASDPNCTPSRSLSSLQIYLTSSHSHSPSSLIIFTSHSGSRKQVSSAKKLCQDAILRLTSTAVISQLITSTCCASLSPPGISLLSRYFFIFLVIPLFFCCRLCTSKCLGFADVWLLLYENTHMCKQNPEGILGKYSEQNIFYSLFIDACLIKKKKS